MDEGRNQIEIDPTDLADQEEDKILQRAAEIKARRIKAAGRSLEQVRKTQERKFEQSMKRYFKDQADHIRKSLNGTKKAADGDVWDAIGITQEEFQALPKTEQQELTMKFVAGLLNWEEEENILNSILTPLWAETYDKGTENVINTYRIPGINRAGADSNRKAARRPESHQGNEDHEGADREDRNGRSRDRKEPPGAFGRDHE